MNRGSSTVGLLSIQMICSLLIVWQVCKSDRFYRVVRVIAITGCVGLSLCENRISESPLRVRVTGFGLFLAGFTLDLLLLSALMCQEPSVVNAPLRTNVVIRVRSRFEYRITALPL